MRAALVLAFAAALCGCAKVEELWSKVDPLNAPAPPPAVPEPAAPPPSMPPSAAVRSKSTPEGDRAADDRIMSLGLNGPAKSSQEGAGQLWDPRPGQAAQPKPQSEEPPSRARRSRPKGKAAPRAR
jgi:hypothetical protein